MLAWFSRGKAYDIKVILCICLRCCFVICCGNARKSSEVTKPVVQSTLEPSAGSSSSAGAAPGVAINTFQIGPRREAPPPGLLPQACLSHGLTLVML